jgi:hypothetical protein
VQNTYGNKNRKDKIYIPELETVPEGFHNTVTETLYAITGAASDQKYGRRRRPSGKKMILPLAAALCLVIGGCTFAAVNLYQQRMENMNREMLERFYAQAFAGDTFHYNRPLTKEEEVRFEKLNRAYEEEGRFPEGEVQYLEDYRDYTGKGVGLYAERCTLFLPDKISDEELLQIIDFQHKVNYSIEKIGLEIVEGEKENGQKFMNTAPEAQAESVIAYEGSVDVTCVTEGEEYLYLAGTNSIERMEIGGSTSKPFYQRDFGENAIVYAMEEDGHQGLYVLLLFMGEDNYEGGKILHINKEGELLYEKDTGSRIFYALAVDEKGRLYAQTDRAVFIYDGEGKESSSIEIPYDFTARDSLCRGKDGKVYALCEDAPFHSIILQLGPETGEYGIAAANPLPDGPPHFHTIAKGKDADFILWNYEGLFTYSLGDDGAKKVMELYEAPLEWEDAMCMSLADGRVLFVKAFPERGAGESAAQSVRFCYVNPYNEK